MPDPMVNVLPVGDGACTILRPWPERDPGPTAVIDCGVRGGTTIDRAAMLKASLNGSFAHVEALVVSHFDWDHWGGFKFLPRLNPAPTLPRLTLYYPAMPHVVPAGSWR